MRTCLLIPELERTFKSVFSSPKSTFELLGFFSGGVRTNFSVDRKLKELF